MLWDCFWGIIFEPNLLPHQWERICSTSSCTVWLGQSISLVPKIPHSSSSLSSPLLCLNLIKLCGECAPNAPPTQFCCLCTALHMLTSMTEFSAHLWCAKTWRGVEACEEAHTNVVIIVLSCCNKLSACSVTTPLCQPLLHYTEGWAPLPWATSIHWHWVYAPILIKPTTLCL